MTLDEIGADYDRAEITTAWVHLRDVNRHVLVLCIIELCPPGQPASERIGAAPHRQLRSDVDSKATLYIRRELVNTATALALYRGATGETFPSSLPPEIVMQGPLSSFPPTEEILLIASNLFEEIGLGAILPRRPSSLRVLSRYDKTGATRDQLGDKKRKLISMSLGEILGVNLERFPEHFGAIHLCFANPIISRIETRLSANGKNLLVTFAERPNRSVCGLEIELSSEWPPFGQGFCIRHRLTSRLAVLPLSTVPDSLRIRVFDQTGVCIEDQPPSGFLRNFAIRQLEGKTQHIADTFEDGAVADFQLETFREINSSAVSIREQSILEYLKASMVDREIEDLRKSKVVMFFPGGDKSREEAKDVLKELIGRAQRKCTIVDSFFTRQDALQLLPFVKYSGCEVRFLSSQKVLSERDESDVTGEFLLAETLSKISSRLPFSVEARKRPGKGVHDRWLQIDDTVYLIGSSVNEFGARATMLFKIQRPEEVVREIESWWETAKPVSLEPNGRTFKLLKERFFDQVQAAVTTLWQMITLGLKKPRKP